MAVGPPCALGSTALRAFRARIFRAFRTSEPELLGSCPRSWPSRAAKAARPQPAEPRRAAGGNGPHKHRGAEGRRQGAGCRCWAPRSSPRRCFSQPPQLPPSPEGPLRHPAGAGACRAAAGSVAWPLEGGLTARGHPINTPNVREVWPWADFRLSKRRVGVTPHAAPRGARRRGSRGGRHGQRHPGEHLPEALAAEEEDVAPQLQEAPVPADREQAVLLRVRLRARGKSVGPLAVPHQDEGWDEGRGLSSSWRLLKPSLSLAAPRQQEGLGGHREDHLRGDSGARKQPPPRAAGPGEGPRLCPPRPLAGEVGSGPAWG